MPEFSPMTFLEVWDKTVEKHSNEIFLIFENSEISHCYVSDF